jgi:pyruvate ferredoxin oxidoreductase gamma subunit
MMPMPAMPLPYEIRWHGRGGQGVVTAAKLLAEIALDLGAHIQSFPQFGSERRGAPIVAFTRISDRPIRLYNTIDAPNIVVVLDGPLLDVVPVTRGLSEGGLLLVDTEAPPAELRSQLSRDSGVVATLPATAIARAHLGRPITAPCLLGALFRLTGLQELPAVEKHVREKFANLYPPEIVEGNLRALHESHACVAVG